MTSRSDDPSPRLNALLAAVMASNLETTGHRINAITDILQGESPELTSELSMALYTLAVGLLHRDNPAMPDAVLAELLGASYVIAYRAFSIVPIRPQEPAK